MSESGATRGWLPQRGRRRAPPCPAMLDLRGVSMVGIELVAIPDRFNARNQLQRRIPRVRLH